MAFASAVLALFSGLGFGLPGVFGLRHFAKYRTVWTFLGFTTYWGGPFESWGMPTSVPLLAAFIAVCGAEVVVGVLLLLGTPAGPWLALALLPFEAFFWYGFALPFGPIAAAARTILMVLVLVR